MSEKKKKNLPEESDNVIPSIFNYCDRWCEKCRFTSRCTSYLMQQEAIAKHPEFEEDWAAAVSYHFKKAISMMMEYAEEQGIDLTQISDDDYTEPKPDPTIEARKAATKKIIKKYEKLARTWQAEHLETLKEQGKAWIKQHEMGINAEAEFLTVRDALDIIRWYQYFIGVKTSRAYSNLKDTAYIKQYPIQNDGNGSAKIAIVAAEKSLGAWEIMRTYFPDNKDSILDIMLQLDRITKRIKSEFPNAMNFIRPGFDEY